MKGLGAVAMTALALAMSAGAGWCADSADAKSDDGPAWLVTIADHKLIAVDGSSITLTPSDDKMIVSQVSPGGAGQTRSFALMTDNMGTVSDDSGRVIGFFRVTGTGIDAEFADSHVEQYSLNGAGGLSLAVKASSGSTCMAWYPAGHVFSEAERRAAVADFASRLGLPSKDKAPRVDSCAIARSAPQPLVTSHGRHMAPTRTAGALNDAGPIMVRSSVPHAIDPPANIPMAPYAGPAPAAAAPASVPAAMPAPAPVPAAAPAIAAPVAPTPVKWTAAAHQTADLAPPEAGHGASDCLEVDSDGANLGFRNNCGYSVQFAYCLQTESESAASCDTGSRLGDVAARGFAPVVFDANIKAADAEHDFRWVACSGRAGEVTPHLDRADPPAGRCVKTKSS
ncbi:MAG: hypothetical protein ACREHE_11700 [Rhizomicrobium sp.]